MALMERYHLSEEEVDHLAATLDKELEVWGGHHDYSETASNDGLASLPEEDSDEDEPHPSAFELLANVLTSTRSTLGLVHIVDEGGADYSGNADCVENTQPATIFLTEIVEHDVQAHQKYSSTNDEASVHQAESTASLDDTYDGGCVAATSTSDQNSELNELLQLSSQVDLQIEAAIRDAAEHACIVEESHRLRRIHLEQRREVARSNLNAKIIQRWYSRRIFLRRVTVISIVTSMASDTVCSIFGMAATQCVEVIGRRITESTELGSPQIRDLVLRQTRQIVCRNDNIYRHVMVIRDYVQYRTHIFILYQRRLAYFVVYLTKRLTVETKNCQPMLGCSTRNDRRQLLQGKAIPYCFDRYFQSRTPPILRRAIVLHSMTRPILLPTSCHLVEDQNSGLQAERQAQSCNMVLRRALSIRIQRVCRGFIIRRRLDLVRQREYDYVDNELDTLLCENVRDVNLVNFHEEFDEEEDTWSPSRPIIEPLPDFTSSDKNDVGEADMSTTECEQHVYATSRSKQSEPERNINVPVSRRKPTKSAERGDDSPHTQTRKPTTKPSEGQIMKEWRVKDVRIAQAMIRKRSLMARKGSNGHALRSRR